MFSVWPELFAFEFVAISLIRIAVGYFFLLLGIRLFRTAQQIDSSQHKHRLLGMLYGGIQAGTGILLLIGLYTQPAALVVAALTLLPMSTPRKTNGCEQHMQILLFVLSVALLFLGPGLFAFDLPL